MTPLSALAADPNLRNGDPAVALRGAAAGGNAKARAAAQNFEGMFLNSMFQNMFTGIDGEGPFGGGIGVGIWRSFLTEQYAKTYAKAGGIGLADHVYRSLMAHQEAGASQTK
jgi:Rod binding domain-containing protein